MRKIILVIALSITTSYAVVPNVEISNATKGPIWYSIGDLKYHPMQATPLKVERGKYVPRVPEVVYVGVVPVDGLPPPDQLPFAPSHSLPVAAS